MTAPERDLHEEWRRSMDATNRAADELRAFIEKHAEHPESHDLKGSLALLYNWSLLALRSRKPKP